MKWLLSSIVALELLTMAPAYAEDQLNVFACEPEWASLAREIGGDKVEAFAATTARQDPHHIRAKPSLIAAIRRADLVVCSGAGLEIGWLPVLQQKAGTSNTQRGSEGYLAAANYVPMLERPTRLDRADGDVHPEGNPHVQLNPHNIALVATELSNRLATLDAANASVYQSNYENFIERWQEAMVRWENEATDLKDVPVVVHHKSFTYLLDWLHMEEVGSLEPKPGIPPTSAYLEELLRSLRDQSARFILRTPYEPDDASEWLSEKTGTPAIVLPFTVGGDDQSVDLFGLFDSTIATLTGAPNVE